MDYFHRERESLKGGGDRGGGGRGRKNRITYIRWQGRRINWGRPARKGEY